MNLYETILSLFINIYFPIYSHIHIQISMHNIHICICTNRKKSGKICIKMLKVVISGSKIYFHLCLFKYFYKFTFIILLIFFFLKGCAPGCIHRMYLFTSPLDWSGVRLCCLFCFVFFKLWVYLFILAT